MEFCLDSFPAFRCWVGTGFSEGLFTEILFYIEIEQLSFSSHLGEK